MPAVVGRECRVWLLEIKMNMQKKKKNETHYYNVTHFFAQKHTFYALHLHDIVTNMKKKWKNEEY